jgi:hypothetical protein
MTVERRFGRAASGRQKSVLSLFPARSEISLSKRTCEALNGCRFTARRLIGLERAPDTSLDTNGIYLLTQKGLEPLGLGPRRVSALYRRPSRATLHH